MIKKLLVPVLCVLLGCAGGAAMGSVTAQTWPEPANVQRWQAECVRVHFPAATQRNTAETNAILRDRGASGWEPFSVVAEGVVCFKRPAP